MPFSTPQIISWVSRCDSAEEWRENKQKPKDLRFAPQSEQQEKSPKKLSKVFCLPIFGCKNFIIKSRIG
jgi:hypothetical protein